MEAAERETVINTSAADDHVRIWTAERVYITALRKSPNFAEIRCGVVDGTEWAEFTIRKDQWNPVRGVKHLRKQSSEQKRANAERLAAYRAAQTADSEVA
jgi:hypothetical protein